MVHQEWPGQWRFVTGRIQFGRIRITLRPYRRMGSLSAGVSHCLSKGAVLVLRACIQRSISAGVPLLLFASVATCQILSPVLQSPPANPAQQIADSLRPQQGPDAGRTRLLTDTSAMAQRPDSVLSPLDSMGMPADTSLVRADTSSIRADTALVMSPSGIDSVVVYTAADSITYDISRRTMYSRGKATINYKELGLKADQVDINWNTAILNARGSVDSSDTTGQRMKGIPDLIEDGRTGFFAELAKKALLNRLRTRALRTPRPRPDSPAAAATE